MCFSVSPFQESSGSQPWLHEKEEGNLKNSSLCSRPVVSESVEAEVKHPMIPISS